MLITDNFYRQLYHGINIKKNISNFYNYVNMWTSTYN